ncbi:murein hydrolase activator EnvC family protein [Snodgrassella alvi]|uniref:murein hydrolase activator EnvC family protein n=1 Tax=Snodgrassella alvi TaxID=1196083 RepID=UPI002740E2AD|nr:peptidoglycan DD-metalloendopeptidase family protein [Snodgrassella alvi]WLT01475.1 peptidoglycan DD-metalloendopeptidase family protein [Snodgrassella alvi]
MKSLFCLILIWCSTLFSLAIAANNQKIQQPTGELKQVHQAISATQNQISKTTVEQKKIDASMAATGQQLNQAKNELNRIQQQQQTSMRQLQTLQTNLDKTRTQIAETQTQIARLLNAHYRNRQPNSVYLMLKNDRSDQKGRSLQYIRYLNEANEQVIQRLRKQQLRMNAQQQAINNQQQQLSSLQKKQQQLINKLRNEHTIQQSKSGVLNQQLQVQNKQLQSLKADEKRLNNLLSRLSAQATMRRLAQIQPKPPKQTIKPKNTGQPQIIPSNDAGNNDTDSTRLPSTLTAEDLALQATENIKTPLIKGLAQKQGRLPRPVNGSISGRFGENRPNGGIWKGLFFSCNNVAVHSISNGNVVYAAFLQGYGNTVIIDHGEGYISIYTGLSSVNVSAGSILSSGQTIGISGKLLDGQNGLYFEIRYHNQAMNPLSWLR